MQNLLCLLVILSCRLSDIDSDERIESSNEDSRLPTSQELVISLLAYCSVTTVSCNISV